MPCSMDHQTSSCQPSFDERKTRDAQCPWHLVGRHDGYCRQVTVGTHPLGARTDWLPIHRGSSVLALYAAGWLVQLFRDGAEMSRRSRPALEVRLRCPLASLHA